MLRKLWNICRYFPKLGPMVVTSKTFRKLKSQAMVFGKLLGAAWNCGAWGPMDSVTEGNVED